MQATMTTTETLLTLDEYFDLPDEPGKVHELVGGRLIEMAKPTFEHNEVMAEGIVLLRLLCRERFPKLRVSADTEFVLNSGAVQAPDIVLLDQGKLAAAARYRGALKCAPDLAVEIVSRNESAEDLDEKVHSYLESGTKTVWVLWPRRRHAFAYHSDGSVQHVVAGEFLEAPGVLPGAKISLDEIFAPVGPAAGAKG